MARRCRVQTWAKKDINDVRKINYTFKCDGKVHTFTSEDEVDGLMFARLRYSWIKKAELVNNEWNIECYED